jgi:hypothetical protein
VMPELLRLFPYAAYGVQMAIADFIDYHLHGAEFQLKAYYEWQSDAREDQAARKAWSYASTDPSGKKTYARRYTQSFAKIDRLSKKIKDDHVLSGNRLAVGEAMSKVWPQVSSAMWASNPDPRDFRAVYEFDGSERGREKWRVVSGSGFGEILVAYLERSVEEEIVARSTHFHARAERNGDRIYVYNRNRLDDGWSLPGGSRGSSAVGKEMEWETANFEVILQPEETDRVEKAIEAFNRTSGENSVTVDRESVHDVGFLYRFMVPANVNRAMVEQVVSNARQFAGSALHAGAKPGYGGIKLDNIAVSAAKGSSAIEFAAIGPEFFDRLTFKIVAMADVASIAEFVSV